MNNKRFSAPASAMLRARSPVSALTYICNIFPLGAIAAAAILATGCATRYKFAVEAVNQTGCVLPAQSYQLVDARPEADVFDPLFAQVARDVHTALSSKGLYPAPEGGAPQILIEIDFGISAPIVTRHAHTQPVYAPAQHLPAMPQRYNEDPDYTSLPKLVKNVEVPFTITTYEKFLRLTARENRNSSGLRRQIWSLYITNKDRSDDLARYARLMVAAAMDDIASDIHPGKRTVLTTGDGRMIFIEKGLGKAPQVGSL